MRCRGMLVLPCLVFFFVFGRDVRDAVQEFLEDVFNLVPGGCRALQLRRRFIYLAPFSVTCRFIV